ncbi:IS30 family transposase [Arthrobacter pascens]|uniref:IS30 family transposase n=1 Tax=Arthrobacter pascens TaxID=1677 RepID=UPI00278EB812|nr:IS30 family transposase [Arthrobacter pascens]MDQ0678729.1 IS30 family transposase [Arthrobacter pascens]
MVDEATATGSKNTNPPPVRHNRTTTTWPIFNLDNMRDQLLEALGVMPATLRRTLTWDRGSEMAKHAEVTAALGTLVYFCDPASPWQRASNENANGLLRQYFRKGADLSTVEQAEVRFAADEINGRPRAVLDWDSATARFASLQTVAAL